MEAKQVLSGPISSSNVGEEFIRVDEIAPADEFGFLNRKTGFLAIAEGSFEKAIEAIKSGKRQVKLGSRNQRSGVFNVTLVNPEVTVDAPGAAANADVTLTHTA